MTLSDFLAILLAAAIGVFLGIQFSPKIHGFKIYMAYNRGIKKGAKLAELKTSPYIERLKIKIFQLESNIRLIQENRKSKSTSN